MATEAELVIIGDELLAGAVQDANVRFLTDRLFSIGITVSRVTFAPDEPSSLQSILTKAFERTSLVITCGGLGPTTDDYTRAVAARVFGRKLQTDEELLRFLEERYQRLGRTLSAMGATQAEVPEGAELLRNPVGAAPGIILTGKSKTLICLPGVPRETQAITQALLPYLKENLLLKSISSILFLRTVGTVETELVTRIELVLARFPGVKVSYLPQEGAVDLRIELAESTDDLLSELRRVLADDLYAEERKTLAEVVGEMLDEKNHTLAVAESCTGGMLAARIVDVPGSSAYFLGGVVSYSNRAKEDLLGVPGGFLERNGAVSAEVAEAMAKGARARFGSTYALSTTGIAGPSGGTPEKQVGLVYVGLAYEDSTESHRFLFPGDRSCIRERTVVAALDLLRRRLL